MEITGVERVRPTTSPAFDGVPVRLGGREYVMPALSFKSLKAYQEDIASLALLKGIPSTDQLEKMTKVAHAALSRNYADVSVEQLEDWIDLSNFGEVVGAVMGVSGLQKKEAGGDPGKPQVP